MADFLECDASEIVFGPTSTALVFNLARALRTSRIVEVGDNVVVDPMSHGTNVWPWVQLAKACGAEVRWLPTASEAAGRKPTDCLLDARSEALASVIDDRTKLVSIGAASNGVGSI